MSRFTVADWNKAQPWAQELATCTEAEHHAMLNRIVNEMVGASTPLDEEVE